MKTKRFTGKKVVILGSGGLKIGQAGEFDYSGSQAIKALKEEGIVTVLINPNIATVQTDTSMADEVYLQPLEKSVVKRILEKEKPDGILLGFGGQTALNLGLELAEDGVFKELGIKILGTPVSAIECSEDRELFKNALTEINVKTARSRATHSVKEALAAAEEIGYPVMIRTGFSLGGLGAGKIDSAEQLREKAQESFTGSSQLLIEEYLTGWKEVEYEVVRDQAGQCVCVCNMENFDPMGIHTGESIVIAPSQTLNDEEYHKLRMVSLSVAEHVGIVGECNIQFALCPKTGDYRVIEMNARLSRSSALASKATGYPLAFVAAKLSLGYLLHEVSNSVTGVTSAFFEPALDYLVVKIPRWDTSKLRAADRKINSEMKSVGEVMGIGRSFPEALQKAIRMLNIGLDGVTDPSLRFVDIEEEIANPTDRRLFALYSYFKKEGTVDKAFDLSLINKWFLHHLYSLARFEQQLEQQELSAPLLNKAKKLGFSDRAIARSKKIDEKQVRNLRKKWNVVPHVKQIDTLAGEFEAKTNYLYMTYCGSESDIESSRDAIAILGSGPYCIGSSVEFDWCAVNAARTLRSYKEKTILINSNPETVSTDFDESDRLYFEELTLERVQDIADFEHLKGIILSFGGQIANNLAISLDKEGYPLLGTTAQSIDLAENREKFSSLLHMLDIDQPRWQRITDLDSGKKFAKEVGYPLLIRPSYVLSGAAMNVVFCEEELEKYLQEASRISPEHPVVISEFISGGKELEVDGIAKDGHIVIDAISEHIENAGVHSGDAHIVLPPQRLYLETIRQTKKITKHIVQALSITGPFNIQFIAKNNAIQVIECNLRASRSLPFVSKVTGHNFVEIATSVLIDEHTPRFYETLELDYVAVKTPQFSFHRLKGASPVAHVEMSSTGEVACLGRDFLEAFLLSWISTGETLPKRSLLVSIGGNKKDKLFPWLEILEKNGWDLFATEGTHEYLTRRGVASVCLYKAGEKFEPNVISAIQNHKVDLVINTPNRSGLDERTDGFVMRRVCIDQKLPLITNLQLAQTFLQALCEKNLSEIPLPSLRELLLEKHQHRILGGI